MNDIVKAYSDTEAVARFQSLQAGHYWRSLEDIPHQGIDAGTVLLIESIKWIENSPHTIILRPHPSKFGKWVNLEIPCDDEPGATRTESFKYDEHRFLTSDFLEKFQFEPDHQKIREAEIAAVQARITELQAELVNTQNDPDLMAVVIENGFAKESKDVAGVDTADARPLLSFASSSDEATSVASLSGEVDPEAVTMATGAMANALKGGITEERIEGMKLAASREHKIATIKAKWIQEKTGQIAATIAALTPYYQEHAAAALAHTEDVRTYVSKLLSGIESLDLYVGKGVSVETVKAGESAGREVPLTLVQKKLYMDEEAAVFLDLDDWFDFSKKDLFFQALCDNPGLVHQIFPTPRCMLVMAVTRRKVNYGNAYENAAKNKANSDTFLLIRDGDNIHCVVSPVESHLGSARLFPSKSDQEGIFRGVDMQTVSFDDVAFSEHYERHENFALHYKRFLILACGLDHRLKLFGDFYDGESSLSFVSMDFQQRYCRFLHDDDGENLLPGEGRISVHDWLDGKNQYLRSGSRVLCRWEALLNPDTAPFACKLDHGYGRGFSTRYVAHEPSDVAVAYKNGDDVCVDLPVVHVYSHRRDGKIRNCKVTLSQFRRGAWENGQYAYLCMDAVTEEEVQFYIHNREARVDHLTYIRFFKQALLFLREESAQERDTRQRLKMALEVGNVASGAIADQIVQQAVIAWRAAHRGKELPRWQDGCAPEAWKSLLDQMFFLSGEGARRADEVAAFVRGLGYEPLRLVLSGGAQMIVYAAPLDAEMDNRIEPHVWVHRISLIKGKGKYTERSRRWASLPESVVSETTLHQWPAAEEWAKRKSMFTSFQEKQRIFATPDRAVERLKLFRGVMSVRDFNTQVHHWMNLREKLNRTSNYVRDLGLLIPIGVAYVPTLKRVSFLCVGAFDSAGVLYQCAPSEAHRDELREQYVRPYASKSTARSSFRAAAQNIMPWELMVAPLSLQADLEQYDFCEKVQLQRLHERKSHRPFVGEVFSEWKAMGKEKVIWLADGIADAEGRLLVDELLDIHLPDNYSPTVVGSVHVISIGGSDGDTIPFARWFDLFPEGESKEERFKAETLARSGRPEAVGYSFSSTTHATREFALEAIQYGRSAFSGYPYRLVSSKDLPEAPQPPAGVDRWYVVPQ
ncbi:hypothetical protein [Herbaspirillum huttiense]|uniref:hypothetical protein n=1 Tax=Herbaspirillum huttiense TaxID=863372 RepID=UPI0039AF6337